MKKKYFLLTFSLIVLGWVHLSAQEKIQTDIDSLSYSYGQMLASQGLGQYIDQIGLDKNDTQKMNSFFEGLMKGLTANQEERANINGMGIGSQIYNMAEGLSKQAQIENINLKLIAEGIRDNLMGNESVISDASTVFNTKMEQLSQRQHAAKIDEGKKFLENNLLNEGVVALPSGLQYKILTAGTGAIPTSEDRVKAHYKGMLIDGTQFDSSYDRGEPNVFGVTQVIPGWTEVLQLMPVGSKWEVYIPYNLAYGERGAGANIPPYATLIFEIELLDIEK